LSHSEAQNTLGLTVVYTLHCEIFADHFTQVSLYGYYNMLQQRKELEKFMTDILDGNLLIAAT
jgi:hypothetical protein